MADNVTLPGTGSVVATDECTVNAQSVQVQLVKLGYGALDTFTIVTGSVGLPVAQQGTWTLSDAQIQGKAAHDAAVSGNPVLLAGEARRARTTAVSADGDVVRLAADRYGRQQVAGIDLTALALQVTASGDTTLVAAPSAGSRLKVVRVEASNSHASTPVVVSLKSASLNSGSVFGKRYLPSAGGAAVWNFPGGHLLCGDAESFVINLSTLAQVEVTIYYETVAT